MERKDYRIENAIITDVRLESESGRVAITLNAPFQSINKDTGEDIMTDTFRLDKLALTQQVVPLTDELEEAELYSAGDSLPFIVLKSVLRKAVVTVDRQYKEKDTLREGKKEGDKNDKYTDNLFKSVFVEVSPRMSDAAKRVLSKQIELMSTKEERVIETRRETTLVRPPFGF